MQEKQSTETGFIEINGTSIYYTRTNPSAPQTIVMIHAGICDQRMWQAQVAHFAPKYQIITFDIHGFGKSGIPDSPFAFHTDIVALLDALNIDKAWLMAASLGGALAFDIALEHPDYVTGMILVAPAIAGYRFQGDPHPLKEQIEAADEAGDLSLISGLEVQMWVDGRGRSPQDIDPDMRQLVVEMNLIALQTDEAFWEHEIEIDPPALERLGEIEMPVLLIYGDLDIAPSLERVGLIADGITGAKKILMQGTAHLPNMEQPAKFNQIVDDFLNSAPA